MVVGDPLHLYDRLWFGICAKYRIQRRRSPSIMCLHIGYLEGRPICTGTYSQWLMILIIPSAVVSLNRIQVELAKCHRAPATPPNIAVDVSELQKSTYI